MCQEQSVTKRLVVSCGHMEQVLADAARAHYSERSKRSRPIEFLNYDSIRVRSSDDAFVRLCQYGLISEATPSFQHSAGPATPIFMFK